MADADLFANIDGRIFSGLADGNTFISREGLEDWWSSPETRTSDDPLPQGHGAQTPASILLGARRFLFRGWQEADTLEEAEEFRAWAASLAVKPMFLVGVNWMGEWRWMRNASVRGAVRVTPHRDNMLRTDIEMTLWSPDAFKYAGEVSRTVTSGLFTITNPGTASIYPWYRFSGGDFTVTTNRGDTLRLNAPDNVHGTTTLSPYTGGRAVNVNGNVSTDLTRWLAKSRWPVVAPGETVTFTVDRAVTVTYYEGAWV